MNNDPICTSFQNKKKVIDPTCAWIKFTKKILVQPKIKIQMPSLKSWHHSIQLQKYLDSCNQALFHSLMANGKNWVLGRKITWDYLIIGALQQVPEQIEYPSSLQRLIFVCVKDFNGFIKKLYSSPVNEYTSKLCYLFVQYLHFCIPIVFFR